MIWISLALTTGIGYLLLQLYYVCHWLRLPVTDRSFEEAEWPPLTLLVVAHNEAGAIGSCLTALLAQRYPADKLEILVVDDRSTDTTSAIVRGLSDPRIRLLALSDYPDFITAPAYKKSAITLAVAEARHDLILMTDADCVAGPAWVRAHATGWLAHQAVFQTGPVLIGTADKLLGRMQAIEYHALMLVTGAGIRAGVHDLANGANMLFDRRAFRRVGGYAGNLQYPSGDDLFLAEKMRTGYPDRIRYVKDVDAMVRTEAATSFTELFRQRLRWAGKNHALQNKLIPRIWWFVGAVHLLLAGLLVLSPFAASAGVGLCILLLLKWGADAMVLFTASRFSGDRHLWRHFIPAQVLFTGYLLTLGAMMAAGRKE